MAVRKDEHSNLNKLFLSKIHICYLSDKTLVWYLAWNRNAVDMSPFPVPFYFFSYLFLSTHSLMAISHLHATHVTYVLYCAYISFIYLSSCVPKKT